MKNIIVIAIILLSLNTFSQDKGWLFIKENKIALDKQQHVVAGMWVAVVPYCLVLNKTDSKLKATLAGIGSALIVGTVKELIDSGKKGNRFDAEDLAYTVGGGLFVSLTFDIFSNK